MPEVRNLVVVLGDQLDRLSSAFDGFDSGRDVVWMAEVAREATHVPSHKARTTLFLSAMRHFRNALRDEGIRVAYAKLDDAGNRGCLDEQLVSDIVALRPDRMLVTEPGEWRVREELRRAAARTGVPLEIRTDRHFLSSVEEFAAFAEGRKELRLEYFYRELRRRRGVLMDRGRPEGGVWNLDKENRASFAAGGPGQVPQPLSFPPDAVTREVVELVERRFPDAPGLLARFDWPVTRAQARLALDDFIASRLPSFGRYQDAMWAAEPFLFHSRLSAAMNLKLLAPLEAVAAAEQAYRRNTAPLAAVEGFIRQVLGWREYVRGIYWRSMPGYAEGNALDADAGLPGFYWTGQTEMACLRTVIGQTLEYGYAHHIQRLMVTGLFSLLLGVKPKRIHAWYLGIYADAVEWVELPNVIGMSQYADGGLMASKPYAASGKYIQRMSNSCASCRYNPARATGEDACPFTTLYWDFLMRKEDRLKRNPRLRMQFRNLERMGRAELRAIRREAEGQRSRWGG